jgi:hypothetical protein
LVTVGVFGFEKVQFAYFVGLDDGKGLQEHFEGRPVLDAGVRVVSDVCPHPFDHIFDQVDEIFAN